MSIKIERIFIILSIITCSLSFGLSYGIGNQNTYLIHGLKLINPEFLTGDWFAHKTHHYHENFSFIIILISKIGLSIPESLIFIEFILRTLAIFSVYKILKIISKEKALISFLFVLSLMVADNTISVAGSFIFSSVLQPSSFGAAFLLISFLFFLRGSYFISGLCMAFSGFMHTNFLLLGFVVFGIAHLFIGAEGIMRRIFTQFFLMFLVFAFNVPFLLSMITSAYGAQATYIFQFIRSPHHYVPNTFIFDFFNLFGWSILGLICLYLLDAEVALKRRIKGLYFGLLLPIVIATVLTTVVFIPVVSKLFFWRMAPFLVLFSQIIFICLSISLNNENSKDIDFNKQKIKSIIPIGISLIVLWNIYQYGFLSKEFLFIIVIFSLLIYVDFKEEIRKNFNIEINQKFIKSFIILIAIFTLSYGAYQGLNNSTLLNINSNKSEHELYQWVRNTDVSSRYLVPPGFQDFRLHGERSIVVDWKSTPIDPDGLMEWYQRIQDISGKEVVRSYEDAKNGYFDLDIKKLRSLKNKYKVNYAVLYTGKNKFENILPVLFKNKKYTVIGLNLL